jgi:hypothetical protein
MAVSLRSVAPETRINFTTTTQVGNKSRFNNYAFQGEVGYATAKLAPGDIVQLVAATKAYFREGSQTDPTRITYILIKQSDTQPIVVIPEPLINLNSVEVAGTQVLTAVVRDAISEQQLQAILIGNGVLDFSITSSQV